MKFFDGSSAILTAPKGCVVTIGNFDSVHLGHQELCRAVIKHAKQISGASLVLSFRPHPQVVLNPAGAPSLLNTYSEKRELLEKLGLDYMVEEPFSRALSQMSPEDFFTDILVKRLDTKVLYLGHDFAMGRDRSGSVSKLRQIALAYGVEVHELAPLMLDQAPVSSSRIRKALELGDLLEANRNLGRPFFVRGIVGKGAGRGKTIGFPTANLLLSKRILPRRGVYITQIQWKNRTYCAVTNLGRNPTFTGDGNQIPYMLESHIFDFSESLYGETLQVDFLKFLRDEQRFSGVAALVEQINLDCVAAREFFKT